MLCKTEELPFNIEEHPVFTRIVGDDKRSVFLGYN